MYEATRFLIYKYIYIYVYESWNMTKKDSNNCMWNQREKLKDVTTKRNGSLHPSRECITWVNTWNSLLHGEKG